MYTYRAEVMRRIDHDIYLLDVDLGFTKWHQLCVRLLNAPEEQFQIHDWLVIKTARLSPANLYTALIETYERTNSSNKSKQKLLA